MEELKKSYALIVQKINDRDQKIQNKENYQVFEREITKNLQTYMETIRQGQDIVQRNKISQEEDQRRMNLLREHLNKHQNLNQKLLNKPTLEIQRSFTQQQERQNNGVELTSTQIVKQQDNQIDALLQTTDKMKLGMKNMGNALDEGKVILKRLDDEVNSIPNFRLIKTQLILNKQHLELRVYWIILMIVVYGQQLLQSL
ncbi:hypothetical protein pb186bvf_016922 [Paramecium bursaria]